MEKYEIINVESTKLKREVKIYISLPKEYHDVDEEYPVLYMHDGQIIFNDFDNDESEVGILDKYLQTENKIDVILVGISSVMGKTRIDELCPFKIANRRSGKEAGGDTDTYLDFIVNELIPIINSKFRTKSSPKYTGMLGVSLGGLCSLYASTKLSSTIANFAFVSSAHDIVLKEILELITKADFEGLLNLYLDVGTKESENKEISDRFMQSNKDVYEVLKSKTNIKSFKYQIFEGSKHETSYWSERFTDIVDCLFTHE